VFEVDLIEVNPTHPVLPANDLLTPFDIVKSRILNLAMEISEEDFSSLTVQNGQTFGELLYQIAVVANNVFDASNGVGRGQEWANILRDSANTNAFKSTKQEIVQLLQESLTRIGRCLEQARLGQLMMDVDRFTPPTTYRGIFNLLIMYISECVGRTDAYIRLKRSC
jgi:hypothetical protein